MTTSEYYGAPPVPPPKATGGVLALGIVNIIYSILFRLCCGLTSLISYLFLGAISTFFEGMPEMEGARMQFEMMTSGPMRAYSIISGFVMLILGILLLCGGIGLIRLRQWGRSLTLGVAVGEIVWALMNFTISIFFIIPRMTQMMAEDGSEGSEMIGGFIGGIFGGIIGVFFAVVYPIVLLILLNTESIKSQFEPETGQW